MLYTYNAMRICIIIFFLSLSLFTQNLSAQTVDNKETMPINGGAGGVPELQEKVSYDVLPSKPKVGDLVDIEAKMYGTPVKDAIFIWTLNSKEYKKGQGLSKISFYVEKETKVSVTIFTVKGTSIVKEWVFNPENVVIFWESNTYTPPFYKGKSLYTTESQLILHGLNLDQPNPLTNSYANYVWKINGKVKGGDSGVAKNSYVYQGDILQQEPLFELLYSNITNYQQTTKTQAVSTRSILKVQTLQSDIFTYEKTPLLGVLFNKKVSSSFLVEKKESTFVAYPLYYSVESSLTPKYSWFINNELVKSNSNSLTFKKVKDNEQSFLDINIKNPKSLLQTKNLTYTIDTTTKNLTVGEETVVGGFGN